MLLSDIAGIFKKKSIDQIPSADLAELLAEIEGRPWAEWGRLRKPISPNQIANQLRHFEVKPDSIKFGDKTLRGYRLTDFEDVFKRYLPAYPLSECNSATTLGKTPDLEVQPDNQRLHPENALSTRESAELHPVRRGRQKILGLHLQSSLTLGHGRFWTTTIWMPCRRGFWSYDSQANRGVSGSHRTRSNSRNQAARQADSAAG